MAQSDPHPVEPSSRPGYRLRKLEVLNWGTFDGKVFSVRPNGETALLVGQNGSGKSTLVDALLTLLVRHVARNLNVAAGARRRERTEQTYVKGAYDRCGDDDGQGIRIKYLRPKGGHYSAILACFHNAGTGETFTVAQLLYLAADQEVQKVYCFSPGERSIQSDLGDLVSTDRVGNALKNRGFRVTREHAEFAAWFGKVTRVKSKAMEVFDQTVAVKDIQRLNDFVRDHMLEPHDWGAKVDRLLGHFTQLSEAHRSLVRVRQQLEHLDPVDQAGAAYRTLASELERLERLNEAADTFLNHKVVELFTPELERRRRHLARVSAGKEALSADIEAIREQCRGIRNELDRAGGTRLTEIVHLIRAGRAQAEQARKEYDRFHEALRRAGIAETVCDEASFNSVLQRLPAVLRALDDALSAGAAGRDALVLERGGVRDRLRDARQELEGLGRRKENIPDWCAAVRQSLCDNLGLMTKDVPFAAELVAVHPDQGEWEASVEKVLRGLALSLLVPERLYHVVSRYVDGTRLADAHGRGRRLVYLRVGERPPSASSPAPGPQSLLRKLLFREGHSLLPWLKAELGQGFDYHCCDSVEEFQECRGLALTRSRHVKAGGKRHEKDDRDDATDPRSFVLGWDNREKKRRIAVDIDRLQGQDLDLSRRIERSDRDLDELRGRRDAVMSAGAVARSSEIDFGRHEREVAALEQEKQAIESGSEAIRGLKGRLSDAQARAAALEVAREDAIRQEALLGKEIEGADKLIENAQANLARWEAGGTLAGHRDCFPDLERVLGETPSTVEDFFQRRDALRRTLDARAAQLRRKVDPARDHLLETMSRFLRACPEEHDLRAHVDYLESFLGLRQRIVDEDLPRHERRFKDRLNEKVIHEIGLFRNDLDREGRGIGDKIETLNVSLRRLEYRPGTHIQLGARPVRDPQIVAFQQKLRECIEDSFDDSAEANETRFLRIQELVEQLADEGNWRWREKVTDVRRWFDFVASVVDRQTLDVVSVYEDSSGQSGGEKAKLAFTILVAAIAYQYDLDPEHPATDRFHFVVVDEMFSKVDDQHAEYALELFRQFGLQLLIVAPLDAKARVTQPYVGCYLYVDKRNDRSEVFEMTAREFEQSLGGAGNGRAARSLAARIP